MILLLLACDRAAPPPPEPVPEAVLTAPLTPVVHADGRGMLLVESTPELRVARERLVALVSAPADTPWMAAHQILALGPSDARIAMIMRAVSADGTFPRTPGVDTHTDLLLKNLLESGADIHRAWETPHGPMKIDTVWQAAVARAQLDPDRQISSWTSPGDMGWSLQAFADGAPMRPMRWQTDGTPMDQDTLTRFATQVLKRESHFLHDQSVTGFVRGEQPLFDLPCGGAHLLQGIVWSVGEGFGDRQEVEGLLQLHAWRWSAETKSLVTLRSAHPEQADALRLQELKTVGHALETLSKARVMGVLPSDPAVDAELRRLVDTLVRLVPELPANTAQVPDAVGDAAHALRGLDLATGTATLAW